MEVSRYRFCSIFTRCWFMGLMAFAGPSAHAAAVKPMGKNLYKRIEPIELSEIGAFLDAKMDTGADTSSLSAQNITSKFVDGQEFVSFKIIHRDLKLPTYFEYPVVKWQKIKKRIDEKCNSGGKSVSRRPVIELKVKLRGREQKILVNLADRSNMGFGFLFGRSAILQFRGVIDPS